MTEKEPSLAGAVAVLIGLVLVLCGVGLFFDAPSGPNDWFGMGGMMRAGAAFCWMLATPLIAYFFLTLRPKAPGELGGSEE